MPLSAYNTSLHNNQSATNITSFLPSRVFSLSSLHQRFCRKQPKMRSCINLWIVAALVIPVLLTLRSPRGETQTQTQTTSSFSDSSTFSVKLANSFPFNQRIRDGSNLEYDFYMDTCPQAEGVVRSALTRIYFDHRDVAPALLRLFFHDCFIEVLLFFLWGCFFCFFLFL